MHVDAKYLDTTYTLKVLIFGPTTVLPIIKSL